MKDSDALWQLQARTVTVSCHDGVTSAGMHCAPLHMKQDPPLAGGPHAARHAGCSCICSQPAYVATSDLRAAGVGDRRRTATARAGLYSQSVPSLFNFQGHLTLATTMYCEVACSYTARCLPYCLVPETVLPLMQAAKPWTSWRGSKPLPNLLTLEQPTMTLCILMHISSSLDASKLAVAGKAAKFTASLPSRYISSKQPVTWAVVCSGRDRCIPALSFSKRAGKPGAAVPSF